MIHNNSSMDAPLDKRRQQKRRLVLALRIGIPIILFVGGVELVFAWLTPSVERARLRTGVANYGAVEAVITASGMVVPEREVVLPSAVDARILRVLRRSGDSIATGEPVVLLDVSESRSQLARLIDKIALKRNEQLQARTSLEGRLAKLDGDIAIKKREAEFNEVKDAQNRSAWEKDYIAANELKESSIALSRSRDELAVLRKDRDIAERSGRLQQEGLTLELSLLQKEREELERQIALSAPVADRAGVLTWVTQTEGVIVRRGDVLARIADLSSYRVQGTVSDAHASQIAVGMAARVQSGTTVMNGTITAIQPAVENGSVTFVVGLNAADAALVRPNLRVEVQIITGSKTRALRIARGSMLWHNGQQQVFVLRSGEAVKTTVVLGMSGTDHVEIMRGVQPGDTVVLSSMEDYIERRTVDVR